MSEHRSEGRIAHKPFQESTSERSYNKEEGRVNQELKRSLFTVCPREAEQYLECVERNQGIILNCSAPFKQLKMCERKVRDHNIQYHWLWALAGWN